MLFVASAALSWCAPAEAQQAEVNRDWTSTLLFEHRSDLHVKDAGVGLGGSALVWRDVDDKVLRASVRSRGGGLDPVQVLEPDPVETFAIAGSFHGGAVAVWYVWDATQIRMATLAPGARRFSAPRVVASSEYTNPQVAMNERGDALIAYESQQGLTLRRWPAGGALGRPEPVSTELVWPSSLAVSAGGTAMVGYQERDRLVVQIGAPGKPFERHVVGRPRPEDTPGYFLHSSIAVGMDAAGNAVAAWVDDAHQTTRGQTDPRPLVLAFKRHDAAGFGAPRDSGVTALDIGRKAMVVTGPGEVIIANPVTVLPANGVPSTTGTAGIFADARRGLIGPPAMITHDGWPFTLVGANERGDAVLTYPVTEAEPGRNVAWRLMFRRRPPHGSFGPAVEHRPRTFEYPVLHRQAEYPQVDGYGNAQAVWWDALSDGEEGSPVVAPNALIADDGPLLTQAPPPVAPSDGDIPPVLAAGSRPALQPPGSALATDRTAPALRLRVERRVTRGRVRARVRCSERCSLRVKGRIGRKALRSLALTAAARKDRTLRLRVPKGAARRGVLRLELRARDAAGNERRVKRTVRLRAAR